MIRLLLSAVTLLALAGCMSTAPYACRLYASKGCQTVQDVYDTARKGPRKTRDQNIGDSPNHSQSANALSHNPQAHGEPGEAGKPIFKQPRVHRVWLAPYVDADGNLRSGEYSYFSTPGEWNYGTTREAGTASSATFGPQRPNQLGFTPIEPKGARKPDQPGETPPAPASVTTSEGVTQPARTLAQ